MITKEYKGYTYRVLMPKADAVAVPLAYIKIPKGHQLYGVEYSDIEADDIQPHGSFTFSGDRFDDGEWWLGWDYGHAGDLMLPADQHKFAPTEISRWNDSEDEICKECEEEIDCLVRAYGEPK